MRISKFLGLLMMLVAALLLIIYTLWMLGFIKGLEPELAVKVGIYSVIFVILIIIVVLGYIMMTYNQPVIIKIGRDRNE